jgi:putative addiction module killer protein
MSSTIGAGNFGDCKSLRQGLFELRIDWGPGYRVYYAMIGKECVLLLCGGDKRKQAADIEGALEYLKDYKERSGCGFRGMVINDSRTIVIAIPG